MIYKHKKDSQVKLTELMLPSHSNFSGKIHGGYILNLMDQIAFACASKHSGNYCVTASVNRVDFLNSIDVGELINLKASVNYTGHTSMVIGVRVEAENIKTGNIKHCNSSFFTMVAKDDDGKNVAVPGLILDSLDSARRYLRSIRQQEHARSRDERFRSENFNLEDYLEDLKNRNAQLTEALFSVDS
ncbi:MAG: acyl-CoA hydrolase [Parvicellaceae bacterium]|jgi:acyl-CoA hydrolase